MKLLEVDEIDFQNIEFMNLQLRENTQEDIWILNRDCVSSKEVLERFVEKDNSIICEIIIWCNVAEEKILRFEDFLCSIEVNPIGYFIPSNLLEVTGLLNSKIKKNVHYEFLCRLVYEIGSCRLIPAARQKQYVLTEEDFITHAYIIKRYLKYLHKNSCLDKVFQSVSQLAIQQNKFADFQNALNLYMSKKTAYEDIAQETAPFIVIMGDETCGGILRDFAEKITCELINLGQAVWKINQTFKEYEKLQTDVCKGVIGFQAAALESDLFKKIKGSKFQFWFDYPLHYVTALQNLPEDYYVLCQDENYARLIREYFHTPNAIHFYPGGTALSDKWEEVNQNRLYDIVFIGSYFEDDISELNKEELRFYRFLLENPRLTFEEGYFALNGPGKDEVAKNMYSLKKACRMVIGHFRKRVIDAILGSGYDVHVYGESWENYVGKGPGKLIRHPQVSPQESLVEWSNAKIGINIMSWHKAGMTERIANIMLSGAVCLSEETEYLKKHFSDGENILTFSLDRLNEIPGKIAKVLEDGDYRLRLAQNAYEKAMKEYTWRARAEEFLKLSQENSYPKLEVYVATHVKFNPPENPVYIPLHVGREGKKDLGYLGDNTGNHISDLNSFYGELTGLFWIWQNVNDIDYVGLCHYRRFFLNGSGREMQKRDYLEILEKYDAIVPKHAECEGSYYEHYGKAHNSRDLDAVEHALLKLYPEYYEVYHRIMLGNIFYSGNLMVTTLSILKKYAEWLFNIFMEASEEIDVSSYDTYHRRVYGFLSEQMFYVFLEANCLSYCEVQIGISQEKAETKELKDELLKLIKEGRIQEAKRLFNSKLMDRPDLLLPGSDIHSELNDVYEQLKKL